MTILSSAIVLRASAVRQTIERLFRIGLHRIEVIRCPLQKMPVEEIALPLQRLDGFGIRTFSPRLALAVAQQCQESQFDAQMIGRRGLIGRSQTCIRIECANRDDHIRRRGGAAVHRFIRRRRSVAFTHRAEQSGVFDRERGLCRPNWPARHRARRSARDHRVG